MSFFENDGITFSAIQNWGAIIFLTTVRKLFKYSTCSKDMSVLPHLIFRSGQNINATVHIHLHYVFSTRRPLRLTALLQELIQLNFIFISCLYSFRNVVPLEQPLWYKFIAKYNGITPTKTEVRASSFLAYLECNKLLSKEDR